MYTRSSKKDSKLKGLVNSEKAHWGPPNEFYPKIYLFSFRINLSPTVIKYL